MNGVDTDDAVIGLSAMRIALGAVSWLLPGALSWGYGARVADQPVVPVLARTFGAREIALGAGALGAQSAGELDRWLQLSMLIDAADAVAVAVAGLRGQIRRPVAVLGTLGAVSAVVAGAWILRRER